MEFCHGALTQFGLVHFATRTHTRISATLTFNERHLNCNYQERSNMAPKKKVERPQENVSLGPQVREGELVFGVARIFASFVSTAQRL